MALKSQRSKGLSEKTVGLSPWARFLKLINKYMLVIIAVVLAIYLSVYPEVLDRLWVDLKSYSGETTSGITFESLFQALLFAL